MTDTTSTPPAGLGVPVVLQRAGVPTLEDVAAVAGVSRATVSRVINDSPRVSPEAKAAVERAVTMLGYVPNRAARSLVTRRTDTVALVVSEPESRVFSDPFFATIVRGVSSALAHTHLHLVLLLAQNNAEHEKVSRYIKQGHVDGAILLSLHGDDPLPATLRSAGVPTVVLGRPSGDDSVPYVDADNRGGGRLATEHLLATGHQRIATITGPFDMTAAVDRYDGYCDALHDAGIRIRRSMVAHADFTEAGGAAAMSTLLKRAPDLDAVFVASDPMALGALRTLREERRRVPEDVAVVGFDDVAYAAHTDPPLTTVRQPLDDMTRLMCELLIRQIEGDARADERAIAPTVLVRRASA